MLDTDRRAEIDDLLRTYLAGSLELGVLLERLRPLMEQDGWGISLDLRSLPPGQLERADVLQKRLEDLTLQH